MQASPIPAGGLAIPLQLTFSCPKGDTMAVIEDFLMMKIKDDKQESEEIEVNNHENTDIGKTLMNTESHNIVLN